MSTPPKKKRGRPRTRPINNPYGHIAILREDWEKIMQKYHQCMGTMIAIPFSTWVVQQILRP